MVTINPTSSVEVGCSSLVDTDLLESGALLFAPGADFGLLFFFLFFFLPATIYPLSTSLALPSINACTVLSTQLLRCCKTTVILLLLLLGTIA